MDTKKNKKRNSVSRRDFLKTSAAVGLTAVLSSNNKLFAAGSDKIRVGVIGSGSRGAGAARDCVRSSPNVEIVAMGDLFQDRLNKSLAYLSRLRDVDDSVNVSLDTCFTGFDAYKKVLACDVDMVILATPPHFRPIHLRAAIEAGKHVFMEKPAAVDPVGVRSVIESSELAAKKGLAIVAGTQRRHQKSYMELMKRVHDGDIGELLGGQCYWNQGDSMLTFGPPKQPQWSEMEERCRRWYYYTWLCGDHIVEQHVHNLDVMNWAFGAHPVQCMGMGGRQVRTEPEYGNIFDHFAVEYEYPNGARVLSMCRQIDGTNDQVSERVVGSKGRTYSDQAGNCIIEGQKPYKFEGDSENPYVQEHADLIAGIRGGKLLNEGRRVAESTLTAIMGRMSAYTGRPVKWSWVMNKSQLDLTPAKYEFGDMPVGPIAVPGKTRLI